MRLTGSRAYYRTTPPKMPLGLVELIEGLTREVLKHNPTDIYGFCAGHVQQLLEIRDGPVQNKTRTLEEKIAKVQEKVRQRAEQRRLKYDNDLLNQQSGKAPEIKATSIIKDTLPILPQDPTPVHDLKTPTQIEQDLGNFSEAELSNELCTPSEDPRYQEIKDEAVKDDEAVKVDKAVKVNEAVKHGKAVKVDEDLKNDIKSESNVMEYESKSNINLAELSNEISDITLNQDSTLNEFPNIEASAIKIEMLDNLAPMVDEHLSHDETQSFQEDQELVKAGVLQEFDTSSNSSPAPVQHVSSPIHLINTKQGSGMVDTPEKITIVLSESEKAEDLDGQNSVTQAVKVTSNEIAETQSDHVNNAPNKTDTQPNDTENIQHFIESETTNRSNIIDNVELKSNSDDTVNGNDENSQEINTFDISFQEPPTVDLQDSQINPDVLESLLESNSDSDIATLITQESTNDELKEHNAFERDAANAELLKYNSKTNGISPSPEEYPENTQHQNHINGIDLIERNNKENTDIDNSGHEYTSTKLSETPQIPNPDSNMDLETAAVTIQKVFRTFLFKSRASTFDDAVNDERMYLNEVEKNKEECNFPIAGSLNERRPHGLTRMDTVLQTVNEEKSLSLSTDDSSTMSSAATVIQAHVRGLLVRNKLHSNKTVSTNSLATSNSNEPSLASLEMDNEKNKNKTVLNIHIVPEGGNYLSRDESLITSMDLSLDSSPPSSINLHPLGYDKSERRKQLKREDAIQSVSPPSNNSGKLSEDVDSVKELPFNDHEITEEHQAENNVVKGDLNESISVRGSEEEVHGENVASEPIVSDNTESAIKQEGSGEKKHSDEMDVVTPFVTNEDNNSSDQKLMHSGEFHDAVLPTKVSRSDTSVASEFKNVLVYFLLWNHS